MVSAKIVSLISQSRLREQIRCAFQDLFKKRHVSSIETYPQHVHFSPFLSKFFVKHAKLIQKVTPRGEWAHAAPWEAAGPLSLSMSHLAGGSSYSVLGNIPPGI